jgi:hypothetical protein
MKMNRWLACTALTLPLALGAHFATAQQVDPEKLEKVSCSNLTFSQDFIGKYPKAGAACIEARVYKGKRYAKFNGKVFLKDPSVITVQVLNVSGDPLDTVSFKPASANASLIVDGKKEKFSDLKVGDPITFWIPESRFSIYSAPGSKSAATGLPPH